MTDVEAVRAGTPLMARPRASRWSPASFVLTATCAALAVYFLIPISWMVFASTKSTADLNTSFGFWFAEMNLGDNLASLVEYRDGIFFRWLGNSMLYSGGGALGATFIASAAGYALARFEFRGKGFLRGVILGGLLIPGTVLALPTYLMLNSVGLVDTYWAVLLPSLGNAFGVFLAQVYSSASVPMEMLEAARVDGAGEVRIFLRIVLRIIGPSMVTIFLFSFISIWNNFFLPLVVLNDDLKWPVTLGLYSMQQSATFNNPDIVRTVVTGSFVATIPLVILFLTLQRYWRSGITTGALK